MDDRRQTAASDVSSTVHRPSSIVVGPAAIWPRRTFSHMTQVL